ncbi:MAG: hypothetical protein AAF675_15775, partial [Pseudomonadota bacterium]
LAAEVPVRIRADTANSGASISALHDQAISSYADFGQSVSMSDLFDVPAPEIVRAVCAGYAPEHRARNSPLEPLLLGIDSQSFQVGGFEIRALPVRARPILRQEIGLRSMIGRKDQLLHLCYELPAFARDEAKGILRRTCELAGAPDLDIAEDARIEPTGAAADRAVIEAGRLPDALEKEAPWEGVPGETVT